ncbi:putative Tic20 family protein [Methylohalomonas lacus]|uniref:Tic20 family protein n=1 Tax=Methylohalomonas lacus TaxID=398773 RepID=A0AAE3HNW2_9GAMM|nr:hypothetical protein [Methylohalomonas lacus]MCS3904063.1 putative Tic20 family protein [Methylohalomonas lacus]
MLDFLSATLGYTLFFMLPLVILPILFGLAYRLRIGDRRRDTGDSRAGLYHINFNIVRYLTYLLVIPAIMLLTSVIMGYSRGFASVLDSMPGLIAAITITFTWCLYRLVPLVAARSAYEQAQHDGH